MGGVSDHVTAAAGKSVLMADAAPTTSTDSVMAPISQLQIHALVGIDGDIEFFGDSGFEAGGLSAFNL